MSNAREKILAIARTLPPAARVMAQLDAMLRDMNTPLEAITRLIRQDAALVSNIIRISNSVVYGATNEARIGEIEEAVTRIGFNEVHRLVGFISAEQLAEHDFGYYGLRSGQVREHMLFTALMCEALAVECGLDPRRAYTAGLMRPLGIMVLDRVAESDDTIDRLDPDQSSSYASWEGLHFGMSNREIAGLILDEWGFPSEIVDAVQCHYLIDRRDHSTPLACVLHLASGIVARNDRGLPGEIDCWRSEARVLEMFELTEGNLDSARRHAQAGLRRYCEPFLIDMAGIAALIAAKADVPAPSEPSIVVPAGSAVETRRDVEEIAPPKAVTPKAEAPADGPGSGWWSVWPVPARALFMLVSCGGLAAAVVAGRRLDLSSIAVWAGRWLESSGNGAAATAGWIVDFLSFLLRSAHLGRTGSVLWAAGLCVALAAAATAFARLVSLPPRRLPKRS